MKPGVDATHAAGAAAVLAVVSLSYLPGARFLHYLSFSGDVNVSRLLWFAPAAVLGAFLFERVVRGTFYGWLRVKLPAGMAAPVVAALGAIPVAGLRLWLAPRFAAPPLLAIAHAYLVAFALGLGLAWLALGTGATWPGGAALSAIWLVKGTVPVAFHGRPVPVLELLAAALGAVAVALVLKKPLAPHRDALWGA
ncbi:MAG TPA: hypothetical protein VHP60_01410 [Thermoanaerobaculia bacterium]|nr:hypothetical protein [Thermoanaerobaculia bacterium]